jgi:hypothetical protein
MPTIRFSVTTDVAPEKFIAALTDFTSARPKIWPNLDPERYVVHAVGNTTAEVTEGASFAGGIWERGTYDWSNPGVVRFNVSQSNAFAPGSYWEYRIADVGDRTRIDVTIQRRPYTVKARLISLMLRFFGTRVFRKDLETTLANLNAGVAR